MKFSTITKICLITLGMSTTMSTFAEKQIGNVKLLGTIYNATCTITVNDKLLGSNAAVVTMGKHSTSAFPKTGTVVSGTEGDGKINLVAEKCPESGSMAVTFRGVTNSTNNKLLAIDAGSSAAQNVGIALFDGDTTSASRLELNKEYTYSVTSGQSYKRAFRAAYESTAMTVVAGAANSSLDVNVEYK